MFRVHSVFKGLAGHMFMVQHYVLRCGFDALLASLLLQWDATNRYNDIWAQYALPDMCAMRESH
jgi:hypothetical protein